LRLFLCLGPSSFSGFTGAHSAAGAWRASTRNGGFAAYSVIVFASRLQAPTSAIGRAGVQTSDSPYLAVSSPRLLLFYHVPRFPLLPSVGDLARLWWVQTWWRKTWWGKQRVGLHQLRVVVQKPQHALCFFGTYCRHFSTTIAERATMIVEEVTTMVERVAPLTAPFAHAIRQISSAPQAAAAAGWAVLRFFLQW
jgi:hypothetical protein